MRAGEKITLEARNNLGSISKLLSAAATGVTESFVNDDSYKSMALATFLNNAHESFIDFFRSVLLIERPEDFFEINQFSEETLIHAPQICLKLKEIVDDHQWLHQSRQVIASHPNDPLNEIWNKLGSPPTHASQLVSRMNSSSSSESSDQTRNRVPTFCQRISIPDEQETEVTLTMRSRRAVSLNPDELISNKKIKVKQALVQLIRHSKACKDLNEVLFRKIRDDEEDAYRVTRDRLAKETTAYFRSQSIIFSPHGQSLKTLADYVRLNTQTLNAVTSGWSE